MNRTKILIGLLFVFAFLFVLTGGVHKFLPWVWQYDKLGHAILYGVSHFFLCWIIFSFNTRKSFIMVCPVFFVGLIEEIRQSFTDRGFSLEDVRANIIGIVLSFLVIAVLNYFKK